MRNAAKARRMLACLLAAALLAGCAGSGPQQSEREKGAAGEPVNLIYYTIGTPDADLATVNEALNKLLLEKINVTVDYRKINWDDYEVQLSALISSGRNYDIAFDPNYATDVQKGAYLRLNDYLATTGAEMFAAIDPVFWEGVTIDGGIYGVPTNKELAVVEQWMFPKELIERYDIDIEQYGTLQSLAPLFAMVRENEPDYLVMELDRNANNFFALDGYEYVLDKSLPLMVVSTDDSPEIVNIFETESGQDIIHTLRDYYLAGYINEDAAVKPLSSLERGKKVFFRMASGGPYSDSIWSQERGYEVATSMKSAAVVTTESTRAGVMCVNASTAWPEECLRFLNCLNTDPEVRNLLNYGLEDAHFRLNGDGQVAFLDTEGYTGVQYTQGNWFILYTRAGEPTDKWEAYRAYNAATVKSSILGFTPDLSRIGPEMTAVKAVNEKYYSSLMTGSVDIGYLEAFNRALEEAGLEAVRQELQDQLELWLKSK